MPCITTTCDTGALTVLSKSFFYAWQTGNRMTMCCFFMSDCSTKVSFLFRHEKKEIRRQTQEDTNSACERPAERNKTSRAESGGTWNIKRFVRFVSDDLSCVYWSCVWPWPRALLSHQFLLFCFCFCKKNCKHARARPKKRKKKKEGSSTEVKKERPKHLQVLIQLGL